MLWPPHYQAMNQQRNWNFPYHKHFQSRTLCVGSPFSGEVKGLHWGKTVLFRGLLGGLEAGGLSAASFGSIYSIAIVDVWINIEGW